MSTEFSKSKGAIVGRGEELNWFNTMLGEQMAIRVHSRDVGGAFRLGTVKSSPLLSSRLL